MVTTIISSTIIIVMMLSHYSSCSSWLLEIWSAFRNWNKPLSLWYSPQIKAFKMKPFNWTIGIIASNHCAFLGSTAISVHWLTTADCWCASRISTCSRGTLSWPHVPISKELRKQIISKKQFCLWWCTCLPEISVFMYPSMCTFSLLVSDVKVHTQKSDYSTSQTDICVCTW